MIWVKEWLQILVTTYVRVLSNIYEYFTTCEWIYFVPNCISTHKMIRRLTGITSDMCLVNNNLSRFNAHSKSPPL
jgi:hypothetical protein